MKRVLLKYVLRILIIEILISPFFVFAQQEQFCSNKGYTIFTINGMFTDEEKAAVNKRALERKLIITKFNNEPLTVDFLYNPTHLAGISDIFDAVNQGVLNQVSNYDLIEIIGDASEKLKTQKVLLVGHSQGNFYTNSFYQMIADREGGIPKKSIGVYGVASPANYVAGGGKYLTSDTDKVISWIVSKFIEILPPNINIPIVVSDGNGHSFSDVYLKYEGSRIISEIKASLNILKENDEQESDRPCISPPELDTVHKVAKAFYSIADPSAQVAKTGMTEAYKVGKYIADASYGIGSFLGKNIRNVGFAVNGIFSNLSANVVDSLGDASNLTTLPLSAIETDTLSNEEENKENENKEEILSETNLEKEIIEEKNNEEILEKKEEKIEEKIAEEKIEEKKEEIVPNVEIVLPVLTGGGGSSSGTADATAPVLSILGDNTLDIIKDEVYTDAGATSLDDRDGDITSSIVKSGTFVDTNTLGSYTIIYTSTDSSNNVSTLTRTINVVAPPLATFTIDTNTTLSAGEYNYDNLIITNNAVLTLDSNLDSVEDFKGVKINAVNITIDAGASISANSKGFMAGPGTYTDNYSGASYGGVSDRNISGPIYGNAKEPIHLGSGGMNYFRGGGAIRIVVSDNFINNGTVSANGDSTSSGGSIYITAKNISGNGAFRANGGALYSSAVIYGSGGGGRIALYYENSTFGGIAEAKGGCGSYDGFSATCAKNGTVGFFDTLNNNFLVKTSWRFEKNNSPFNFKNITFADGAKVIMEKEVNISADELLIDKSEFTLAESLVMNIPSISLNNNSKIIFSGEENITSNNLDLKGNSFITVLEEKKLSLTVSNINIESGSYIHVDAKGSLAGLGAKDGAGSSYGGVGAGNLLTSVYGSETEPVDFGSGGGNNLRGGGAMRLIVNNILTNNGIISANGGSTSSGGSIYITAKNISGNGAFRANGGGPNCTSSCIGPGGGGRVALYYEDLFFTGQTTASGASSSSAGTSTSGSVKLTDTNLPPADEPDTTIPSITSYTFNGVAGDITTNPLTLPIALVFNSSENVDWVSIKIEKEDDATYYKMFLSGAGCVDGTNVCNKNWNGALSGGGLLVNGVYKIKIHIKDEAENEFYDYITPYVINVNIPREI